MSGKSAARTSTAFSPFARARVAISRAAARTVVESGPLCRWTARKRSAPIDGRTLDPQLAATLWLDDIGGNSDLRGLPPAKARARVAESIEMAQVRVGGDVATTPLELAGPAGPIPARLYVPAALPPPSPGLLYIHGGGFVTGDIDTHDSLSRLLAALASVRVVSIDYRLAPEHRFPAAAEDSVAAFRDLAARAGEFGIDPSCIAVAGDSAGGNLTSVVSLRTRNDSVRPALQVPLYAALDATCQDPSHTTFGEGFFLTKGMCDWYYGHYFGSDEAARKSPDGSPLFATDFSRLPPALVYTSGFDPLRDEGVRYAERLREAGVPVRHHCFDDMLHGFLLMTGLSRSALHATERVARELGEALRSGVK